MAGSPQTTAASVEVKPLGSEPKFERLCSGQLIVAVLV